MASFIEVTSLAELYAVLGVHKDGAISSQILCDDALVVVHQAPRLAISK
jgi:hypothetical protein